MPILPDLSYARTRSTYVPRNLELIDNVGAALERDYNKNKQKADLVLDQMNKLKVRDVNTPILNSAIEKARAGIEAIAQRGDYENADLEINKLADQIGSDPLLKGALNDYQTYSEYQKQLGELKDVTPDRVDLAHQYSNATNNKMVEYDPIMGYKNIYKGYTPQKTPDFNKIVGEFTDKIKASKEPVAIGQDAKGNPIYMGKANNGYYIVGDREGIDEGEALKIIASHVASNPQMQGYLKENLMFDKFQRKYNPATGEFEPFTSDDFGGAEELYNKLKEEGVDPNEFQDPRALENLYDNFFLEKNLLAISEPYAKAVGYSKTNFDYKQDNEWLNKQKSDLALKNSLAKLKAEEASQKRIIDYKYKKDEEKEQRQNAQMVLSNPVESEPINLEIAEKNLDQIDKDLKLLTSKKEAAKNGGVNSDGSPITFSAEENNKLATLQNDKRLLEEERGIYLKHAVDTPVGEELVRANYDRYVKITKNAENISYDEFKNRLKNNQITTPRRMPEYQGARKMTNDTGDINTWLLSAKDMLARTPDVQTSVQKAYNNEANGLFAVDDGSTSAKASVLSKVKTTLKKNVLAQNGVGYDVVGSSERLQDILNGLLTKEGEELKVKGKKVEVEVIPLDREQRGATNEDVMYQMVIKDKDTGKTIRSMRIRPQDQGSHSDLMYDLNKDLASSFDPSTKIGKNAQMGIINYELPQFKVADTKKLLDGKVNDSSQRGQIGVGPLTQIGNSNWVIVKSKTPVVDHFNNDDSNHPVTVLQEGYHLVKLRDGIPAETVVDENNINKFLANPNSSIYDNAFLNERNISNDNLRKYGAKNKDFATHFNSIEDALTVLHSKLKQK